MSAHPMYRYHIDSCPLQHPKDWVDDPPTSAECGEWVDDLDGSMRVSAMAIIALLCLVLGLGLGYLIWS